MAESRIAPERIGLELDPGIAPFVEILQRWGIETFESCEAADGHCFAEPTIRFHGGKGEGFRAIGIAMQHGLPVSELRLTWAIEDGQPTGPKWALTFTRTAIFEEASP